MDISAFPYFSRPEVFLRDLDDMVALRSRLENRPSVVVVGGGPLGMEIASGARAAGCEVTLVSRGQPMRRHLGAFISDNVVAAARAHGVTLRTEGCATVRQTPDGLAEVVLRDGSLVTADVLVSAVGDVPNLEWLDVSGLLTDGRLVVDSRGRVLVKGAPRPDIVAAGDVATFPTSSGLRWVLLWTSAIDQAKIAGPALLLGDDAPALDFKPYFWTASDLPTSDLDLFAEEVLADRDPYFAELRETAAVVYLTKNEAYALTRYEAIRNALGDPETFSSTQVAWNDDMNNALRGTSLASDPPQHAPLRAALSRNLAPRALRPLKAEIDAKADRLVASLVEKGSFDVVPELARAFPLQIVSDLIGVTGVARENILRWGGRRVQRARPDEPAHDGELPDRGRAVRLDHAGQGRRPHRGEPRPRDLRRR